MNKIRYKQIILCVLFLLFLGGCTERINQNSKNSPTTALDYDAPTSTANDRAIGRINTLATPTAIITAPIGDQVINVGQSLSFSSDTSVPANSMIYRWNFAGAAKNSFSQVPGAIDFLKAGDYQVALTTVLSGIESSATTMNLTVLAVPGVNQAPTGNIQSPATDLVIASGDIVNFSGEITDPENNSPFSSVWTFDGASASRSVLNPGPVSFDTPGTYKIMFTAFDSFGQVDTNPASRFITVADIGIANADFPESTIVMPAMDMTIVTGDVVDFEGLGESLAGNVPLTYLWDFGGAAPESTMDIPPPVTFDMAGVYTVMFTAIDSLAQPDPTPAQIIITVEDPAVPPVDPPPGDPTGIITAPNADVTIMAGDVVDFMGEGTSPVGNDPVTYVWNFDGAVDDFLDQNPGPIIFDSDGIYEVTLTVTDSMDNTDPMPPSVIVTVEAAPPVVDPPPADTPVGEITAPTGDMTIVVGDSVDFMGMGISPIANDPVTYLWDFSGGAPEFLDQNPGMVAFDIEGMFEVILTVTDSAGVADPTPPSVIITVDPVGGGGTPPVDPVPTDAPVGEISSPDEPKTITVGDSVKFSGEGESPTDSPLTFLWNFGGAAPDAMDEEIEVLFDAVGEYTVTFTVTDEAGMVDAAPPMVLIIVEP